jgi:ATP synthase protein I
MRRWQAALRFIGVGWFVGLSIISGVLGGLWLDGKLNTRPLFVIIGLLLGILVAFYGFYKMLSSMNGGKKNGESR